ncbi:2738_t:CDS:2 [Dentiscutata erythropus]|uniref:2738_t:CDS:1 n=1 Tax=Dentiscutata erythropus TaxID=1348616 RepID=A0A9N9IY98_9GLOM|nr:2738_t:CDS:2 [Dentiscutata erythropus]
MENNKENPPVNDSEHNRKKHAESEQKRRDEMKIRFNTLREILASTSYPSNDASKGIQDENNSLNQSRVNWDVEKEILNKMNHLNEEVNRLNEHQEVDQGLLIVEYTTIHPSL